MNSKECLALSSGVVFVGSVVTAGTCFIAGFFMRPEDNQGENLGDDNNAGPSNAAFGVGIIASLTAAGAGVCFVKSLFCCDPEPAPKDEKTLWGYLNSCFFGAGSSSDSPAQQSAKDEANLGEKTSIVSTIDPETGYSSVSNPR